MATKTLACLRSRAARRDGGCATVLGDLRDHLGIDHRGLGVELLVAGGLGEQRGEHVLGDEAELDQDGAEHLARALLLEQGDLELIEA